MAHQLRSKYRLILNPKPYLAQSRPTSSSAPANASQLQFRPQSAVPPSDETDVAPPSLKRPSPADSYRRKVVGVSDDSLCSETGGGGDKGSSDGETRKPREMEKKGTEAEREGDDSYKYLRDFVEKSLNFDEEKVRSDGLAARKMMLAKMKCEWKSFLDGKSSGQKIKMLEDNTAKRGWTLELGKEVEKENGDERITEPGEIEKKVPGDRSLVDLGDMEEKGSRDWTVELGEVEEKIEGYERSAEVRKMEQERRDRSVAALWSVEETENGDWTAELGDVEENAKGYGRIGEVTEMEQKEKRYRSVAELGDVEGKMIMKKKKKSKNNRDWTVELGGVEENKKGDTGSAEVRGKEKEQRDRSVAESGKMEEEKKMDNGIAEMRQRKEKDEMGCTLAKLSEMEEREQRNGTIRDCGDILPVSSEENVKEEKLTKSWDLLQKMKKSWNKASSFVFGDCSECVQKLQTLDYEKGAREGLDKMRGTEKEEIMSNPVDYPGSNNLKDTSQMLKTEKKILVRRMTESKAVPQKLTTLDEERIQRDDFAKASETMGEVNTTSQTVVPKKRVISEYDKELQDRLQKFKANVNEEKERIRLTCNEVLRDSFQKLHEAMLEEEKYIKSKCDGALRESVQKLQHNIQDEKKRIKSAYNQVLTDSLQELQNRTEEEMRRIRSTYLDRQIVGVPEEAC